MEFPAKVAQSCPIETEFTCLPEIGNCWFNIKLNLLNIRRRAMTFTNKLCFRRFSFGTWKSRLRSVVADTFSLRVVWSRGFSVFWLQIPREF